MRTGFPREERDRKARRARVRVLGLVVLVPLALTVVLPLACGTDTSLSGPGEECFAATDCQAGLVCVPQRGGSRLCSNDLTMVAGRPPPEAGAATDGEAGADGATEGSVPDGPVQDSSMPDTNVPDTNVPDAADSG